MKKIIAVLMCLMLATLSLAAYAENEPNALVKIENGATGDFDGDGTEEPVAFTTERDEYGDGGFTLTVGDTTMKREGCISLSEDLYAVSVPRNAYYADDGLMGTMFIASEYGPSDDPVSYCYFYSDGVLYDAGTIEALPTSMHFSGRTIETSLRSDMLGTWSRPATFILAYGAAMDGENYTEEYHLTEVPQDIYAMGLIADVKTDLPLQASRTDDTVVGTIVAGEKIAFGATDNQHWVYAESMDGQIAGWFYVDESDYPVQVRVADQMINADDVFGNLMYAD